LETGKTINVGLSGNKRKQKSKLKLSLVQKLSTLPLCGLIFE